MARRREMRIGPHSLSQTSIARPPKAGGRLAGKSLSRRSRRANASTLAIVNTFPNRSALWAIATRESQQTPNVLGVIDDPRPSGTVVAMCGLP